MVKSKTFILHFFVMRTRYDKVSGYYDTINKPVFRMGQQILISLRQIMVPNIPGIMNYRYEFIG